MDIKIARQFTLLTFSIVFIATALTFALYYLDINDTFWINQANTPIGIRPLLNVLYALSPAIVSYIILKKNNKIASLKEWLKNIFYAKSSIMHYLFIAIGLAVYFTVHIIISGTAGILPIRMFGLLFMLMLINGGMEEAGWRYLLQPILIKKYGFIIAAIIVSLIWYAWHLPLFFIPGADQTDLFNQLAMYYVMILSQTVFYGAIITIAGRAGVFLSVLYHTLLNAINNTVSFQETWSGTIIAGVLIMILSVIGIVLFNIKR